MTIGNKDCGGEELSDPKHTVDIAMFKMDTIEEIRIIEEKKHLTHSEEFVML